MRHRVSRDVRSELMGLAGLLALVATLALGLAACGAASSAGQGHASAPKAPTPTATPARLNWRTLSLPASINGGGSETASPVDGHIGWLCAATSGGQFAIWRTQDAGATWSQVSTLAPTTSQQNSGCSLVADQNSANGVAAFFTLSPADNSNSSEDAVAYYSRDGGVDWTALPPHWWIQAIATSGATLYALALDLSNGGAPALFASSDHLATWRVDSPTSQVMQQNVALWAAPTGGDLLVSLKYSNQLYHSTDGGVSWTTITAQASQAGQASQGISTQLAAWRGAAGWLICGEGVSGSAAETWCSADLGKTWSARQDLRSVTYTNTGSSTGDCFPQGVAADGALYAACGVQVPYGVAPQWILARLPLGSTTWATVGAAPGRFLTLTQTGPVWLNDDSTGVYVLDQLP